MSSSISFLSDFGHRDEFVGVVHGVIARIAPAVRVIDVTHGIDRGDVRGGALSLMRAIQYLPQGVALAVVDPGVGTSRKAIAVATDWGMFVGPDNGLLSPAVALSGGARAAHAIDNPELVIPSEGATFDGRDRFGPAAAVLADDQAALADLGPELDPGSLTPMLLPLPDVADGAVTGAAWWIDHFGNVQTNVSPADLAGLGLGPGHEVSVKVGAFEHVVPFVGAYGDADPGAVVLIVDSAGMVSLAVRDGRADEELGLGIDRPVVFRQPVDS